MKALLPSRMHRNSSLTNSRSSRRLTVALDARLAKPTTVKGTNTVGARKQQLANQLAKQEQQQKKTLAGSKTTRGLSSASSEQAGTGASSKRRGSRFYFNFTGFPFPLGPFWERKTVRTEVRRAFRTQRGSTCCDGQLWTALGVTLLVGRVRRRKEHLEHTGLASIHDSSLQRSVKLRNAAARLAAWFSSHTTGAAGLLQGAAHSQQHAVQHTSSMPVHSSLVEGSLTAATLSCQHGCLKLSSGS